MSRVRRRIVLAILLLVSLFLTCLTACGGSTSTNDSRLIPDGPIATAPAGCWKRLLRDAYDGSIDGSFEPRCYRAAIAHLPMDDHMPMRSVLETGVTQAVGALVPPQQRWASVRRSVREGRAGARGVVTSWNAWLAADQLSGHPTRFASPSRSWFLARLKRLEQVYHFRVLGLRYLHRFGGQSRPAPMLIVRADPGSFVRATPLVLASLDQQPRTSPTAKVTWNYEAFFFEARDAFGAPFLAVFNNWRSPHPGGGQWAPAGHPTPFSHG
jgi:hypothetical protein